MVYRNSRFRGQVLKDPSYYRAGTPEWKAAIEQKRERLGLPAYYSVHAVLSAEEPKERTSRSKDFKTREKDQKNKIKKKEKSSSRRSSASRFRDRIQQQQEDVLDPSTIQPPAPKSFQPEDNQPVQDIADDPSQALEGMGTKMSDKVPLVDPNEADTEYDSSDPYELDPYSPVQSLQDPDVEEADPIADERFEAPSYEADTALEEFDEEPLEAQQQDVSPDAIVDPSELEIDTQGVATGVNPDGTVNVTGQALSKSVTQQMTNIIDTSTTSGKLIAQELGQGNYIDSKATVLGQMQLLQSEFMDDSGVPVIPSWAQGVARNVMKNLAFRGITGTTAQSTLANALMEATLPYAREEAAFFQTLTLKNLDNRQQAAIKKASVLAQMDLANLDTKSAVAVQNAKSFMAYDMANLNNRQQSSVINSQNRLQVLLEDTRQQNLARRSNAESEIEIDKFYTQLQSSINTFNVAQRNQMEQFNAGQTNDISKFNSQMENIQDQYNTRMKHLVDKSNIEWRRTVTMKNTENKYAALTKDIDNMISLSTSALNRLWDRVDKELTWNYESSENEKQREASIEAARVLASNNIRLARKTKPSFFKMLLGSIASNVVSLFSDPRLKKNSRRIGETENGLGVWSWQWNNKAHEIGCHRNPTVGFMASEVMIAYPKAVSRKMGYLMIDYSEVRE